VRVPAGAIDGGQVAYNDRYAWQGQDYAPLRSTAPLWLYARDGELEYWAADLALHPPRLRYRIGLDTADGRRWFGFDGLRDTPAPRGAFEFAYVAEGDLPDSPAWAAGAVFYHIFPDRYARSAAGHRRDRLDEWDAPVGKRSFLGGDLDGIVERLDHIASLSVDALYLTPIFSSPSNHKYDTADYFTVDADFGGNAALRRLVDALHGRAMRLILDGVFNHAGAQWPPFVDALRNGADSPYASWFYLADGTVPAAGAAAKGAGPGYETWAIDVASLPKLRTSEPAVRDLVCRIGRHWAQEFGIDGWRLDVANEVDHATWRAFRAAVRAGNPEAYIVGEVWTSALPWLRGEQFDSVMNYPWREALLGYAGPAALDGRGLLDAIDAVRAAYPEPVHPFLYNLIGSHDAERPLTEVGGDAAAAGLAAALLFALPGAVSIYYGDEVGMAGGKDPACRDGMVWDGRRQDRRLLELYRRLGKLRRAAPALRTADYQRLAEDGQLVAFGRGSGDDRLVAVANASRSAGRLASAPLGEWLDGRPALAGTYGYDDAAAELDRTGLRLPPQSVTFIGRHAGARPSTKGGKR
jgi:glycosidase